MKSFAIFASAIVLSGLSSALPTDKINTNTGTPDLPLYPAQDPQGPYGRRSDINSGPSFPDVPPGDDPTRPIPFPAKRSAMPQEKSNDYTTEPNNPLSPAEDAQGPYKRDYDKYWFDPQDRVVTQPTIKKRAPENYFSGSSGPNDDWGLRTLSGAQDISLPSFPSLPSTQEVDTFKAREDWSKSRNA